MWMGSQGIMTYHKLSFRRTQCKSAHYNSLQIAKSENTAQAQIPI